MIEQAATVVVTGAMGLIGRSLTKRLLGLGYEVLPLDLSLGHDLTDPNFVKRWFRSNHANHLINLFALNDAITSEREFESFLDLDLEDFRKYMDVNVIALLSVCREFIRNQTTGTIINFSSIYGVVAPKPSMYHRGEKSIGYSVSKAAVIQLTRHLATHTAPSFRVNCVVPGGIESDQPEEFILKYSREAPIGRMMNIGETDGIVEYLLSDSASYCTGAIFNIDGGWTAW